MNHHQKELVSEEEMDDEMKKFCADCKTTKTPLWRGGPAGPKSLCNACGIRYRKKRSAVLGLNKGPEKRKDKPASITTNTNAAAAAAAKKVNSSGGSGKGGNLSEDLRVRLVALGKEVVMLQRQRSPMKRQRSNRSRRRSKGSLGEEEQAAVLLMALSCGSVFA